MPKLPIKLGFSNDGIFFEIWSSHASPESAEKSRDRHIAEIAAKRQSHLYNGWWIVVDTCDGRKVVSALGSGRAAEKPLPLYTAEWIGTGP